MYYQIEIKFHDGTGPWATTTDKFISIISKKTHVEGKIPGRGSFSSTSRSDLGSAPGRNGVRYKDITYSNPERWKTYTLWVTQEELTRICLRCDILVALELKYDFQGAAGCIISGHDDPWKYFCSEVVYDGILTTWLPEKLNYKMHPDKLEEVVIKLEQQLNLRKEADVNGNV